MFTVEITSMPGVEQLLDVLPALLVARPGHVGVGELVDERDLRAGGRGPRRRPSPRTSCRGSSSVCRGTTSRSPSCAAVLAPAVGLDEPDDDVGAAVVPPAALVEHRERLADAGRGAEVDAELAARHRRLSLRAHCQPVEGEVELEHVDPRLAEEAERAAVGVLVDQLVDRRRRSGPAPGDSRRLQPGVGHRDVRVEPGPDAVTASTGTFTSAASPFCR